MDLKFIKLRSAQGPNSKLPAEAGWRTPEKQYSYSEVQSWLKSGHNVGVVCGVDGLIVLDIDNVQAVAELGVEPWETMTVRTGSGGLHLYYQVEIERPQKVVIFDPTGTEHLGEVQAYGQYVVAPGCRHPNGNIYKVLNPGMDICKIRTYDEIIGLFTKAGARLGMAEKWSGCTPSEPGVFKVTDIWGAGFKKAGSQICGKHPVHGSRTGSNLVIDPARNIWHCFRCNSGGGPYEALAVDAGIIDCRDAGKGCLRGSTFVEMVKVALERKLYTIPGDKN